MNRTLRCLAAAAGASCLAGAAAAQTPAPPPAPPTNVKLYGLADMSVGRFQEPGGQRIYRADSGGMTTSYLGVSGSEDLGGGLQARFVLEAFHRMDTGAQGRFGNDTFFARNAYVALSGAFGSTALGRNTTPLFLSTLQFNAFGDSFAFSPSIRQYFTAPALPGGTPTAAVGDSGWSNSLLYVSPRQPSGLAFSVLFNAGEGASNALGRNLSASVSYIKGPIGLMAVGQQVKNAAAPLPAGFRRQDTYQLSGSYDFTAAKVFAQYGEVRTDATVAATDAKTKISGLGLSVPVGAGRVLGQIGYSKTSGGTGPASLRTASVGYDHFLSKSTDVYAVYMNERASYVSPTGNTVAAGIRLRF